MQQDIFSWWLVAASRMACNICGRERDGDDEIHGGTTMAVTTSVSLRGGG